MKVRELQRVREYIKMTSEFGISGKYLKWRKRCQQKDHYSQSLS
jgi:hypothetical protein